MLILCAFRNARRTLKQKRSARVLYIGPTTLAANDLMIRLKDYALPGTHLEIRRLDTVDNFNYHRNTCPSIGVVTPIDLLVHLGGDPDFMSDIDLIILEDLHLLDAAYELAILRVLIAIRFSTTRLVALSTSLQDVHSLGGWLKIQPTGIYSFKPTDRAIPLITTVQSFTISHGPILLKAMVKPVYAAIKSGLPHSTIVFVPSQTLCREVANNLVTQSGMALDLNGFLAAPRQDLEGDVQNMANQALVEPLLHGIGVYHEGMNHRDMGLILSLFAAGILRVLIVPREGCWTLPVRASNVIVMGAQYLQVGRYSPTGLSSEKKLTNYSMIELVKMQSFANLTLSNDALSQSSSPGGGRFLLMCQAEQKDAYMRFLEEGLPLESRLGSLLRIQADREVQDTLTELLGQDPKRQDLMDLVSWSYLWVRMSANPVYYDVEVADEALVGRTLSRMVDGYFAEFYRRQRGAKGGEGGGARKRHIEGNIAFEGDQAIGYLDYSSDSEDFDDDKVVSDTEMELQNWIKGQRAKEKAEEPGYETGYTTTVSRRKLEAETEPEIDTDRGPDLETERDDLDGRTGTEADMEDL